MLVDRGPRNSRFLREHVHAEAVCAALAHQPRRSREDAVASGLHQLAARWAQLARPSHGGGERVSEALPTRPFGHTHIRSAKDHRIERRNITTSRDQKLRDETAT